jgi:2-polyprenyl-3-methyl-5-hydroxy-6-metoxy-1,4-benzoquinol methylase
METGREKTREPQYNICLDIREQRGLSQFGLMSNQVWQDDPRRLTFLLARYKFVSKMFSGMEKVLEVGCADAFATRVVAQEVKQVTAVDFDPVFVRDAISHLEDRWQIDVRTHDMLDGPVDEGSYDGAFSLDVLEHIPKGKEDIFVANIANSLNDKGVLIIGTPSLQSQIYASPPSREGHINCKDASMLRELMSRFFHNIFIFSMNDEIVHTGFYPMAHYLIALCCLKTNPRNR